MTTRIDEVAPDLYLISLYGIDRQQHHRLDAIPRRSSWTYQAGMCR